METEIAPALAGQLNLAYPGSMITFVLTGVRA